MRTRTHLDGDQLIATRDLDAEPALVWEAFTKPAHLAANRAAASAHAAGA